MKYRIILLGFLTLFFLSCEENQISFGCGPRVVISADFYANAIDETQTSVLSAEISGDCLFLSVTVSDICDINDVTFELLDSGNLSSEEVPQRFLRLVSSQRRACGISENVVLSFDIRSLRAQGNQVSLNIQGYSGDIVYSY